MRPKNFFRKRYMLIFFVMIPLVGFISPCIGQDDQKQKNDKEFNEFQNKITNDFSGFQSKNDSIFLRFLETSWKEFKLFREEIKVRVKPVEQPMVGGLKGNTEEPPVKNNIQENKQFNQPEPEQPGETLPEESTETAKPGEKAGYSGGLNFFGQQVELPAGNDLPSVRTISNAEIVNYYKSYTLNKSMANTAGEIAKFAKDILLNDWGCLYLLILASEKYYPEMNSRVLFVWMTMLKHGFDVRIAHDASTVFLLVNFGNRIFNKLYVNISNQRYYVYTFPRQPEPMTDINSYEAVYPKLVKPVSLVIDQLPGLTGQTFYRKLIFTHDTVFLSITLPLIEFMNAYPDCELPVYFNAPASDKAMKSMDKLLLPTLTGKSETEKVAIILSLVQKSMPYKIDEAQFGKENYLFADETLYYPFSDCEDRVILLSKLIERYTGLSSIGLDYSEHVSLGIKFTKPIQGDFVDFKGEKYYICDPTYIGAKIGMAMDFMKNENPEIIQTSQKN